MAPTASSSRSHCSRSCSGMAQQVLGQPAEFLTSGAIDEQINERSTVGRDQILAVHTPLHSRGDRAKA